MLQIAPIANGHPTSSADPVRAGLGARITGVSIEAGFDDSVWREIEMAWNTHHALIFPEQSDLTTEKHIEFLARFGPVLEERMPGEFHSFVSNDDGKGTDEMNDGYREGPLTPHMDYTYTPYPADVISLFATDLPESGSKTTFFSNTAPLERMPAELRAELETYHVFCAHDLARMQPDAKLYLAPRTDPDAPTQGHVWPLIREHPNKPGVAALICTLQQTERIIELSDLTTDDAASRALLGRIFDDYLYVDANRYDHDWKRHDLVIWDNVALQHGREACPRVHGHRTFRRVAVCEAGNAIHETVAFLGLADTSVAFS